MKRFRYRKTSSLWRVHTESVFYLQVGLEKPTVTLSTKERTCVNETRFKNGQSCYGYNDSSVDLRSD
jgi:hypothetical protein